MISESRSFIWQPNVLIKNDLLDIGLFFITEGLMEMARLDNRSNRSFLLSFG